MRWLKKRLAGGTVQGVTSHIVATYILPLGAPIVTVVIGYISDLPWFWIWLGALAAFAFITTGLLRFDEWFVRMRVEGKLFLVSPGILLIRNQGYALGVQVQNNAVFPIEVELEDLRTQFESKIPKGKRQAGKRLIVQPNNFGWFYDNPVEFETPKPGAIVGTLEAKLKYGRVGSSLQYSLEEKKQLTARFDEEGEWAKSALWTDIVEG